MFPGVRYKLLADGGIFKGCARSLFYVYEVLCSLSLHRGFQTYLAAFSRVAKTLEDVTEPY